MSDARKDAEKLISDWIGEKFPSSGPIVVSPGQKAELISIVAYALRRYREENPDLGEMLVELDKKYPGLDLSSAGENKWWIWHPDLYRGCSPDDIPDYDTPSAAVEAALREMDTGAGEEKDE